ncbi:MAG: glycosyltransferase family 2 protein, partial [Prevotellaceae bacterium]|nr:glycosyltransferase family 2 protein [Prevotellaceae bacterium]
MKRINCFIHAQGNDPVNDTINALRQSPLVADIYLLSSNGCQHEGCRTIAIDRLSSSATVAKIAQHADADYVFIYTGHTALELGQYALERFYNLGMATATGLLYSDYYRVTNGIRTPMPTIDYQSGSLRDDFNFGSVLFYRADAVRRAVGETAASYDFAGLYNLRLKVSQFTEIYRINEFLYSETEQDASGSGEKLFDYVDPKNRAVQIEMEHACTEHLKAIGAYLPPHADTVTFDAKGFANEASVIIPVRNRERTLEDAVLSVLSQETNFPFNLIIIDNHSTDRTSEIIAQYARQDARVIHIIPARTDLGIGGCWNVGVDHPACGKFAVQLDSDDVYETSSTLQTIVDTFYETGAAMVVGSYTITDINMQTIPPGLIDHREWTSKNGHNNALRINGLGAPRAFYTPLLRQIRVPNTS